MNSELYPKFVKQEYNDKLNKTVCSEPVTDPEPVIDPKPVLPKWEKRISNADMKKLLDPNFILDKEKN